MSQEGVERFLGRLLTDDQFLQQATISITEAAVAAGYPLSYAELQAIRPEDLARLTAVSTQLDDTIKRFSQDCHKPSRYQVNDEN